MVNEQGEQAEEAGEQRAAAAQPAHHHAVGAVEGEECCGQQRLFPFGQDLPEQEMQQRDQPSTRTLPSAGR